MGSRWERGGGEGWKVTREDGFSVSKNKGVLRACKVVIPVLGTQYIVENKTANHYSCHGTIITGGGMWVIRQSQTVVSAMIKKKKKRLI